MPSFHTVCYGISLGMRVYDYCSHKSLAIGSAQALYPQFNAETRDCVKNGSQVMLGTLLFHDEIL